MISYGTATAPQHHTPAFSATLSTEHISDHDLERYCLNMVTTEAELAGLEEHLLYCTPCVERAEATQAYVDAMRVAGIGVVVESCSELNAVLEEPALAALSLS